MRQPEGKLVHMTNVNSTLTTHGLTTYTTSDPPGVGPKSSRGWGGALGSLLLRAAFSGLAH